MSILFTLLFWSLYALAAFITFRKLFANALERDAGSGPFADLQQLLEMPSAVAGRPGLALGAVDQADLHVVTHRAGRQVGQDAEIGERVARRGVVGRKCASRIHAVGLYTFSVLIQLREWNVRGRADGHLLSCRPVQVAEHSARPDERR